MEHSKGKRVNITCSWCGTLTTKYVYLGRLTKVEEVARSLWSWHLMWSFDLRKWDIVLIANSW